MTRELRLMYEIEILRGMRKESKKKGNYAKKTIEHEIEVRRKELRKLRSDRIKKGLKTSQIMRV